MSTTHPTESFEAYVLATLSPAEMLQIDAHVRECAMCRRAVQQLHNELFEAPYPQVRPHVKAQLFQVVAFDRDFGAVARAGRMATIIQRIWVVVLFVLGSALASIVIWNGYAARMQSMNSPAVVQSRAETTTQSLADFMAQDGIETVQFARTEYLTAGSLYGYVNRAESGMLVVGRNVPMLDVTERYAVWVYDHDDVTLLGTITPDTTGSAWLYLPQYVMCETCSVEVTRESSQLPVVPTGAVLFYMVYSK